GILVDRQIKRGTCQRLKYAGRSRGLAVFCVYFQAVYRFNHDSTGGRPAAVSARKRNGTLTKMVVCSVARIASASIEGHTIKGFVFQRCKTADLLAGTLSRVAGVISFYEPFRVNSIR